jgi:hypothetical protein
MAIFIFAKSVVNENVFSERTKDGENMRAMDS